MPYRFLTADVFTAEAFGGNQLAVLPDARGLSPEQMLAITREFNYSESTFVLPPDDPRHTRRVRIFTPGGEVPFAGHPTVGTAFLLCASGAVPLAGDETRLVLEEGVGPVPVLVRAAAGGGPGFCQLSVARLPETQGPPPDPGAVAAALSLGVDDLVGGDWAPAGMSCGLPFLMVPVRSRDAVRRARVRMEEWERTLRGTWASEPMVFAMDPSLRSGEARHADAADIHARVFVPGLSVPEDPATGSACAALGGYLALRTPRDGALRWTVSQGVDMGRPSVIRIEVDKAAGDVTAVRVGGDSVWVSEGTLRV